MQTYLHEYFLSVYGIRTLSDFYILELLEGLCAFFFFFLCYSHA
jgi:hypothetical protein